MKMHCPKCDKIISNPIEHLEVCDVKPERLANVGLITLEELNIINSNRKGIAPTIPSPKHN